MATTKIWTKAEIKAKLVAGDKEFLTRGLMAVYEGQTAQEKLQMTTKEDNGVGFSAFDAEILTSFAEQWRRNQFLSQKQFNVLVKRMPKYAGQLERIAAQKRLATMPDVQPELSVMAEASETPVVGGWITFPNGAKVNCMDLAEVHDNDGDVTEWTGWVDGVKYTLIND